MSKLKLNRRNYKNGGLVKAVPPKHTSNKQYTIKQAFYYLLKAIWG